MSVLLLQLLLAHLIGDFFLQPTQWVRDKEKKKFKSKYLYLHALIHVFLIIIIVAEVEIFLPAVIIGIVHLLIDGLKLVLQTKSTKRTWFFVDQILHILSLIIVWMIISKIEFNPALFKDPKLIGLITAILFLMLPTSFIIKNFIAKWTPTSGEIVGEGSAYKTGQTLEDAGQWIGMMERLLILVFILVGKWEGVGFLLAAKSIFRFGDLKESKDRKLTEYVLIGTLLSFSIAIGVGIIYNLCK